MSFKQKVIDALKSDKFSKGKHRLGSHDGKYCCLGVMTKLVERKDNPFESPYEIDDMTWNGSSTHIFLHHLGGNFHKLQENLIQLNDQNDSFEPVIEFIEEQVSEEAMDRIENHLKTFVNGA